MILSCPADKWWREMICPTEFDMVTSVSQGVRLPTISSLPAGLGNIRTVPERSSCVATLVVVGHEMVV